MRLYTPQTLPTEPGLYKSGGQVWELDDEGFWSEIHGDGAEFGDHPLVRLVPDARRNLSHRDEVLLEHAEDVATKRAKDGIDTEEGGVIRSLVALVERLR